MRHNIISPEQDSDHEQAKTAEPEIRVTSARLFRNVYLRTDAILSEGQKSEAMLLLGDDYVAYNPDTPQNQDNYLGRDTAADPMDKVDKGHGRILLGSAGILAVAGAGVGYIQFKRRRRQSENAFEDYSTNSIFGRSKQNQSRQYVPVI